LDASDDVPVHDGGSGRLAHTAGERQNPNSSVELDKCVAIVSMCRLLRGRDGGQRQQYGDGCREY
jgi:hypothetical protein